MLDDLEWAKNETKHLESKKEELILKEKEIERNENERNKQLQHEMQLEETPQSASVQLFKMQSDGRYEPTNQYYYS
jgi:hypothetical protein